MIFESEEEEATSSPVVVAAKNGMGRADVVIPLGGLTFGSNGIRVITPTNWKYSLPAGSNQFKTALLDVTGA